MEEVPLAALPDDRSSPLPTGDLQSWLVGMQRALRDEGSSDVPCGECTACCASSQFVHVGPDEPETLARIPRNLRFPAPGMPPGHVVLGYDEQGRCPMLGDHGCTIYEHRPRTCRTYDCRVFPATGVIPDKPLIAQQARRWVFDVPTAADRTRLEALRAAAAVLVDGLVAPNATQRAVLAVESVLGPDPSTGESSLVKPNPEVRRPTRDAQRRPRR